MEGDTAKKESKSMRGKSTYTRRNHVGSVLHWTGTAPWLDLLYLAVGCVTYHLTMLTGGSMQKAWRSGIRGST